MSRGQNEGVLGAVQWREWWNCSKRVSCNVMAGPAREGGDGEVGERLWCDSLCPIIRLFQMNSPRQASFSHGHMDIT